MLSIERQHGLNDVGAGVAFGRAPDWALAAGTADRLTEKIHSVLVNR